MASSILKTKFSPEEYLVWEAAQEQRHEYICGEVFAMAGAEDRHVTVSGNMYIALRQHLRGTPCRAYIADVRVQVQASDAYFYPDVFVTCSAPDALDRLAKREPILIVEVLSPSTAAFDAGAKFAHYRQLESLQEYLLIDIGRRSADLFRKSPQGQWLLLPRTEGEVLQLASVDLEMPVSAVFDELEPESAPNATN